jgi:hypothetical protein
MYKRYLLKYFGTFTVFIDRAVIEFQKHWLINCSNTIGDCLIIPRMGTLHEDLFCLAHNSLGHFSFKKSYTTLRAEYYWPNMQKDLCKAYIPACVECQCDKSCTTKPIGPLHPLPIPDQCGDSITIDFIRPCPHDDGFGGIVTITDILGQISKLHRHTWTYPQSGLWASFLIFGIVKMAFHSTSLATMTNYLSASFGKHSQNLPESN